MSSHPLAASIRGSHERRFPISVSQLASPTRPWRIVDVATEVNCALERVGGPAVSPRGSPQPKRKTRPQRDTEVTARHSRNKRRERDGPRRRSPQGHGGYRRDSKKSSRRRKIRRVSSTEKKKVGEASRHD